MKKNQDAFGNAVLNHHKGQYNFEVIEREDGYIGVISASQYLSNYKEWPAHEKRALKKVKGKVLDIGCGAGRISIYLQNKGLDVIGIDISPLAVKTCRIRGLKKAKVMPIEKLNFPKNSFDTIIMFGNNFGLFANKKKIKVLLRKMSRITAKNGQIIAETMDPYRTKNPAHLGYHKYNEKRGRMGGQIRMRIRNELNKTPWFDYLFVTKKEMRQLLKGTDWKIKGFIDSKTPHYFAVLVKR
ncbi:MAG: methyltransferase domain-containing protein [Candidatus Micrarchaeota archaeon]